MCKCPKQWEQWRKNKEGKRVLKRTIPVPCGYCIHCRINASRIIQHRIMLESTAWESSCFLTLTMDDEYLYYKNKKDDKFKCELDPMDLTRFFQKLRKELKEDGRKFKYFAIGEYGKPGVFRSKFRIKPAAYCKKERKLGRPHYHVILFGVAAFEKGLIRKCWRYGNYKNRFSEWEGVSIGDIDFGQLNKDSASYVAGYCTKKRTKETNEIRAGRAKEFQKQSIRPAGIGDGGIKEIADQLRDDPHWDNDTIITELIQGNRAWPLGRYLMNRWIHHMEIPTEVVERYKDEYTNCLIDEHCGNGKIFIQSIMEESEGRRKRQIRLNKIFDKRRYL
jgi:hypothetical protein